MKTYKKLLVMLLVVASCNMFAQEEFKSFGLGISPIGKMNFSLENKKGTEESKYNVQNFFSGSAFYETQLYGNNVLIEGVYSSFQLESEGQRILTTPLTKGSLYLVNAFYGVTINKQKRIQFPLYIGIGGGYIDTDNDIVKSIAFGLAAKARVKFYFSNKLALFGGATYSLFAGSNEYEEADSYGSTTTRELTINFGGLNCTMGIIFSL